MAKARPRPRVGDHVEVKLSGIVRSEEPDGRLWVMLRLNGQQWVDVILPADELVTLDPDDR